ncbi:OLC1v1025610C2 [Oldenlandia corymbosa var. corymbosa]|uniref:cellulase n=1 Tax=Oldenlandia corymbosa var. corymbosa TaxID=529605 RepID=A0AAV1C5U8_OLDCO|nr:OLC1v1025610C2 [Oldenlandia corymbosa var. corymbosa]
MHNHWGGSFEINSGDHQSLTEDEKSRNMEWDRASVSHQQHYQHLDETQQSWLLGPPEKKKKKYVDLGCVVCSTKALKWTAYGILIAFFLIGLPVMIVKLVPKHKEKPPVPDNYTLALNKALLFFNAQKSGRLPKDNKIPWRGDSGLQDGSTLTDVKGGLVGGYYDAGDNIKFHFPMSFAMTMLSWSVIEYEHKYRTIDEYNHVRELIKWGTDYLLLTFNSSATDINKVYSQVGTATNFSTTPDDHYCWTRPEDMDYPRQVLRADTASDLGSEMAAALAAASIVFRDDDLYSKKLVKAATTVFAFARDKNRGRYSNGNSFIEPFYNSTGYWDEFLWGSAWMYYATGNVTYLRKATAPGGFTKHGKADRMIPDLSVLSWDNKFPAAMLLLTRMRMVLNPGYPYEEMLKSYHNLTGLTMCSYLQRYNVFNWTQGGLILLDHGRGQNLQYVANAAFLASLFVDYMNVTGVPGWHCGPTFIPSQVLRDFATSQVCNFYFFKT